MTTEFGNSSLYGYICEINKCEFNPNQMRKNGKLYYYLAYKLINSISLNDKKILNITEKLNKCYLKKINSCSIFAIVECSGNIECQSYISYVHEKSQLTLYER